MPLTPEQVQAMRTVPVVGRNRVRLAREMLRPPQTQTEIAAALGWSSAVPLSDIERGEYQHVTLTRAQDLAAFYGCAVEDLFPTERKRSVA